MKNGNTISIDQLLSLQTTRMFSAQCISELRHLDKRQLKLKFFNPIQLFTNNQTYHLNQQSNLNVIELKYNTLLLIYSLYGNTTYVTYWSKKAASKWLVINNQLPPSEEANIIENIKSHYSQYKFPIISSFTK